MYKLTTNVCGNPDRGQDPSKPPFGVENTQLEAKTFNDLLYLLSEWESENSIGGGNWMDAPVYRDENLIGYMSYNGKVWADKKWTPSTKRIYLENENV